RVAMNSCEHKDQGCLMQNSSQKIPWRWGRSFWVAVCTVIILGSLGPAGTGDYAPWQPVRALGFGIVQEVAYSPDGRYVALASSDGFVEVRETMQWSVVHQVFGHTYVVYSVSWSPDGTRLASGGADRRIIIWDTKTGDVLHTLIGHQSYVYSVRWSPS